MNLSSVEMEEFLQWTRLCVFEGSEEDLIDALSEPVGNEEVIEGEPVNWRQLKIALETEKRAWYRINQQVREHFVGYETSLDDDLAQIANQ